MRSAFNPSYRMCSSFLLILTSLGSVSAAAAQMQRRATFTGAGNDGRGKCTVEVVVDGSADIEINGDSAIIRNQSGQQPQWRRFECTGAIPANPGNFRFSGIDGRGRQQLIRNPQNGGPAVVRIEDSAGGSEGYTFDLTWGGGSSENYPPSGNDRFPGRQEENGRAGGQRDGSRQFGTDQAVRACQEAIRAQAARRFNGGQLTFRETNLDDRPGRRDWVMGTFDVRDRQQRGSYRFTCSVNFDSGQIRSAEFESLQNGRDPAGYGSRTVYPSRQVQICERAVLDRFQRDGYPNVDIESINADSGEGRSDWIVGTVRANRGDRSDSFNFSCSLDRDNMTVRTIDLKRR
jgi:hypothetical protein